VLAAVTKYSSISRAAKALNITHSAVSQSIKQLEHMLGYPLLVKSGRNIAPTDNAKQYVDEISGALNQLAMATKQFQQREGSNTITVKMVTTLALRWFIPLLTLLKASHPELTIKVVAEPGSDIDNLPLNVDAGIGYGHQHNFTDLHSTKLADSELLLVSHKQYADIASALAENSAIYVESPLRINDWTHWCQHNNIAEPNAVNRLVFPNSAQALEAVSAGMGILVTQHIFVKPMLKTSLLFQLGQTVIEDRQGYYFYCLPEQIHHLALANLEQWLRSQSH